MKIIAPITLLLMLTAFIVTPRAAHISLISPKPIMDGYAENGRAHKNAPFGAPGVDAISADATIVRSGGQLELEIDMYIYHRGEIVVLYTQDPTGEDIAPTMTLPSAETPIPHKNLIHRIPAPCIPTDTGCARQHIFKTTVTLPEITGDLYLVVRQIMTDSADEKADGSVDLSRVYYHQTAKLHLVRD